MPDLDDRRVLPRADRRVRRGAGRGARRGPGAGPDLSAARLTGVGRGGRGPAPGHGASARSSAGRCSARASASGSAPCWRPGSSSPSPCWSLGGVARGAPGPAAGPARRDHRARRAAADDRAGSTGTARGSTAPDGVTGASDCVAQWSPWPFALVGAALVVVGVVLFVRTRRALTCGRRSGRGPRRPVRPAVDELSRIALASRSANPLPAESRPSQRCRGARSAARSLRGTSRASVQSGRKRVDTRRREPVDEARRGATRGQSRPARAPQTSPFAPGSARIVRFSCCKLLQADTVATPAPHIDVRGDEGVAMSRRRRHPSVIPVASSPR